jgi:hypothetical protein
MAAIDPPLARELHCQQRISAEPGIIMAADFSCLIAQFEVDRVAAIGVHEDVIAFGTFGDPQPVLRADAINEGPVGQRAVGAGVLDWVGHRTRLGSLGP